jgi:V/A-type H+-transporting ATPase subunit D
MQIIETCLDLLQAELKKVMQRVNLFEKIKIPEAQDNIRRIRIAVGDQMTAAVARAKIAKSKLEQKEQQRAEEAAVA